jgi:hypothetical protein
VRIRLKNIRIRIAKPALNLSFFLAIFFLWVAKLHDMNGPPLRQGHYKNLVLDECSDECPKDEMFTNFDLGVEEVLSGLMKKPVIFTKVDR